MRFGSCSQLLLFGVLAAANGGAATTAHPPSDPQKVGRIRFETTCTASVRGDFERGVAVLHSFFYDEARRVFTEVARKDPSCAIARWGIAMTWWHPIWASPTDDEMNAGRAALAEAVRLHAKSARERDYIAALGAYYRTPEKATAPTTSQSCHGPVTVNRDRVLAYEQAMRQVHERYPKDFEAAAFYALALLGVGYATPSDTTLSKQLEAADLLETLGKQNPDHPGVAHYLIHSYDYPSLAARGLPAAQAYASLAPRVPHALHMPSHIFTRLGMWQESIDANAAAAEASRNHAAQYFPGVTDGQELHALDYMEYAYLQMGRDDKAKEVAEYVATLGKTSPEIDLAAGYGTGAIPARFVLERRAWKEAAALSVPAKPYWAPLPFAEAHLVYAQGLGRARSGDLEGAQAAAGRLAQLRDATTDAKFEYFRKQLDLQRAAVSAWVSAAQGKRDEALLQLHQAADAEDALGKHPVSPGAIYPIREQLGEMLLDANQAEEALTAFETDLELAPRRFNGLAGAGRAAERAGKRDVARRYYEDLVAVAGTGDGRRPELAQAKAFLEKREAAAK
jgi:tetratricopeptide (TPR) repeat protein